MNNSPSSIINENFLQHATFLQSITNGMKVINGGGFSLSDSAVPSDTFNILYITDAAILTAEAFSEAVRNYDSKQLPFCVWINEEQLTQHVRNIFDQTGLKMAESEPGMIVQLNDLHSFNVKADIRRMNDEKGLEDFARIVSCNWEPPDQNVGTYYQRVASFISQQDNIEYFGYYVDGIPVAAIELFPDRNNNAGIYSLCTLATHRRKGIGTTLLQHCLDHLKNKGYNTASLQASDDGVKIYRRLGFREATRFFEYKKYT